jgi:hypothetical protein
LRFPSEATPRRYAVFTTAPGRGGGTGALLSGAYPEGITLDEDASLEDLVRHALDQLDPAAAGSTTGERP